MSEERMADPSTPSFPPIAIGTESRPPTVVLPDPSSLFGRRAARFRALAPDHPLGSYLRFLADLADAQQRLAGEGPAPQGPDEDAVARSVQFEMPAIAREALPVDQHVLGTLHALFDAATDFAMPDTARAALTRLRLAGDGELADTVRNVIGISIPAEAVAEHVFVGAAVQVHLARMAAGLGGPPLRFIGDGVCPACGGPPATSSIVNWSEADRSRFALCGLCATRWNAVRVKCLACSSTKGIHYKAIEGIDPSIKAECCDECRSYVKILSEDTDPGLDGIADDVASLGLDMLVREDGYRRAGFNLFLIGA
jgi:FdhE protein